MATQVIQMDRNENNNLAAALCKAQSELKHALKDSMNPHFKNKYASLTAVLDAVLPVLNKNGIVVTQPIKIRNDGSAVLETIFTHSSGQSWVSECPLLNPKGDMQGLKSAVSYARRLSLEAMSGTGEEDDDGEGTRVEGEGAVLPITQTKYRAAPSSSVITEPQAKRMWAIAKSKNASEAQLREIVTGHGFQSSKEITRDAYDEIIKEIESL